MKIVRYILCALLIAAAVGLLCYNYFVQKQLDSGDIIKAILIIISAILSILRPRKRRTVNKKALYEKAYSEFISQAFYDEPRLEKRFYDAIHDYNQGKPAAGVAKLDKLRRECQRSADIRAVATFTALCLDDMKLYKQAIAQYQAALSIRGGSTLYSNMGLCHLRLGNDQEAEECFRQAIQLDRKNAFAYNNLASLYFRLDEYEQALEAAQAAIAIDAQMRQALSVAAICCALLGHTEDYERYYRKAVANGANGKSIKQLIEDLDPD